MGTSDLADNLWIRVTSFPIALLRIEDKVAKYFSFFWSAANTTTNGKDVFGFRQLER